MKRFFLKIILIFSLFWGFSFPNAFAQGDMTQHFMRGVQQTSYSNPALCTPTKYYFGAPLISSIHLSYAHKGFLYKDLFSRVPGSDSLQLNVDQALSKNQFRSFLSYDAAIDLLSLGYFHRNLYFGLNLTERSSARASYTKDLVDLLWNGSSGLIGAKPDMSGMLNAVRYSELGLRLTYEENSVFYGVRLKLLSGIMNVLAEKDSFATLRIDSSSYETSGRTNFMLRSSGLHTEFSDSGAGALSFQNMGMAIDAGFEYRMNNDRISLSGSIRDLGSIRWKNDVVNYSSNKNLALTGRDLKLGEDSLFFENTLDSLSNLLEVEQTNDAYTSRLIPKYYLSAAFKMTPKSTLGFLMYFEFIRKKIRPSFSLNYGKKITEHLEASLSYSIINNTYGNFGAGIFYKKARFQFYFASDNLVSVLKGPLQKLVFKKNVASLYLPKSSQIYSLQIGVNIALDQEGILSKPSLPRDED